MQTGRDVKLQVRVQDEAQVQVPLNVVETLRGKIYLQRISHFCGYGWCLWLSFQPHWMVLQLLYSSLNDGSGLLKR